MCTVRLRYKTAGCRSFVMPGDIPALLEMSGIELLDMLKVTCEEVGGQQADWKFNFQTIQLCIIPNCRTDTSWKIKSVNADAVDAHLTCQIISG